MANKWKNENKRTADKCREKRKERKENDVADSYFDVAGLNALLKSSVFPNSS